MKRFITLFPAIVTMLISCQQNLVTDNPEIPAPADEVMTKSLSSAGKVTPDDPVVFLPATNMKAWTDIGPLEERFAACEVPESRLKAMTTEALVKSMMNYPLNYLVFVYEPNDAINLIIKHSPLHREFLSRADAAEVFVDIYDETELDMSREKSCFDGNYTSLSYANAMFMDYFLGSKLMTSLSNVSVKQKLAGTVSRKFQERISDPGIFSIKSVEPLLTINEVESLGISSSSQTNSRSAIYEITVLTIREKEIDAYNYTNNELTNTEMENLTNLYVVQYPNATLRGATTRKYNSHSYAWYESSIGNRVWIDYNDHDNNPQLQKFWTDDAYVECSEEEADVILYTDTNHSAIKLTNGNYLSKWGEGPLMEHAPSYGPFSSNNIQYFKFHFTPVNGGLTISGITPAALNQPYYYNLITPQKEHLTYTWDVLFMDAPEPKPFWMSVEALRARYCNLIFRDYGLFKVKVYALHRGYQVASGQMDVIVLPDEYITQ